MRQTPLVAKVLFICVCVILLVSISQWMLPQGKPQKARDEIRIQLPKNWPELVSPMDTTAISSEKVEFTWKPLGRDSKYNLQISTNGTFPRREIVLDTITSSTKVAISKLNVETRYYWRVRGGLKTKEAWVWGRWSPMRETLPRTMALMWWPPFLLPAPKLLYPPEEPLEHVACIPDRLQWTEVSGARYYQVQIDDDATFSSPEQVIFPVYTGTYIGAGLEGSKKYYWRVRSETPRGLWSKVGYLWGLDAPITGTPSLLGPPNGSANLMQPIILSWTAVSNSRWYEVTVRSGTQAGGPLVSFLRVNAPLTNVKVENLTYGQTYSWSVQPRNMCGVNWPSPVWSFTPYCPGATAVPLASPLNNASNLSLPVQFMWYQVPGMIKYQLQVDNAADFSSPELDREVVDPYLSTTELIRGQVLHWRVRGNNGCAWGPFSATWQFMICPLPVTVAPVFPLNQSSVQLPVVLKCGLYMGMQQYQFQVSTQQDFSSLVLDQTTTGTTLPAIGLVEGTSYYWRVRAFNGCEWGPWNGAIKFTVCYSLTSPTLKSPLGASLVCNDALFFDWDDVLGASKYRVVVSSDPMFSSPDIDREVGSSEYRNQDTYSPLYSGMKYYWRVCAANQCGWGPWSKMDSLTTEYSQPVNVEPADGTQNVTEPILLKWRFETCETLGQFKIVVDDVTSWDSQDTFSDQTSAHSYSLTGLKPGRTYGWSVHYVYMVFVPGSFTFDPGDPFANPPRPPSFRSTPDRWETHDLAGWPTYFSTFCPSLPSPLLILPADGATGAGQSIGGAFTVILYWGEVSGAQKYQLQVDDNSDFSSPVVEKERLESAYFCTGLSAGVQYYWRVRTYDVCGWGGWSSVNSFIP